MRGGGTAAVRVKASDEWATPDDLFAVLDAEFHFTFDVAATSANSQADTWMDKAIDGLKAPWDMGPVWLNPPYSNIGAWLAKAQREVKIHGVTVVCLLPCSPDVKWWAEHVEGKAEVRLLTRSTLRTGRVHFVRPDGSSDRAPFPSCVVIYRPVASEGR